MTDERVVIMDVLACCAKGADIKVGRYKLLEGPVTLADDDDEPYRGASTAKPSVVEALKADRDRWKHCSDMDAATSRRLAEQLRHVEAVVEAVKLIEDEGYVESMQNVPSWQQLAAALATYRKTTGSQQEAK